MKNSTKIFCISFIVHFITFFSSNGICQKISNVKLGDSPLEIFTLNWQTSLEDVRIKYGASERDFITFERFKFDSLELLKEGFGKGIKIRKNDTVRLVSEVSKAINETEKSISALYDNFLTTKKLYPSSVAEFSQLLTPATTQTCDPAGCTNIDFNEGTLNTWYGYYAENWSSPTAVNIIDITGGVLGAVTEAANDPLSMAWMNNQSQSENTAMCGVDYNLTTDYQISLTSSGNDRVVPGIKRVSPWATGGHSVMLGDSQLVGGGVAILSKTFSVSAATASLTYQYAVILMDPAHNPTQQPFFSVEITDAAGNVIPNCGIYTVTADTGLTGYGTTTFNGYCDLPNVPVFYKNWSIVNVPLKEYIGQCVTITFEVVDCAPGGHFGYAYVNASCAPLVITSNTNILCPNGTATLSGTAGASHYSWTGPSGHSIIGSDTLQNIIVDSAGTYTLVTTPVEGATCHDTITYTLAKDYIKAVGTPTNVTCFGGNNGSAAATATNGGAPYTYSWSTNPVQTTDTATGLTAGTYTITVHDTNGCQATAPVIIAQPGLLTAITTPTNVLCNGETNGSATASETGGTAPYTYLWAGSGVTTATTTGLSIGTYTVTVTDINGCTSTADVVITQPTPVTATITGQANVPCNGGTGSATVAGGGGTPGYTYLWQDGQTNATAIALSANTYSVIVTDKNGCTATTQVTLTQPPAMIVTTSSTAAYCNYSDGTTTVTGVTGGTPPYSYTWLPSGQTTQTAVGISAGTYTVQVEDNNGCTITTTVTVTQPPPVIASIVDSTGVSCFGGNNGTATATAINGFTPYTYSWDGGGTTLNQTASNLSAGTYTVTVTDNSGCLSTTRVVITQPPPLSVTISGATIVCAGSPGIITASPTGGTAPYTYSWGPGIASTTNTASVSPTTTTTYTVTVHDNNGCTATSTWVVTTGPPLFITTTGPVSMCSGGSATICASTTGGYGGITFAWQPGNYTTPCITVTPSVTTIYTVTATDNCGESATASVTVQINPFPDVSFHAYLYQGCIPFCVRLYNTSTISSGSIVSYSWKFGNGDTSSKASPQDCYPNPGVYSVTLTATSNFGCSATLTKPDLMTAYALPVAAFTYSPNPGVIILSPTIQFTDQSTPASATAPIVQWTWPTFGDATDSTSIFENPEHTYQDTGRYCPQLIVEDIHGCKDSVTNCLDIIPFFTLYIPSAFSPNGDGLDDTFFPKGVYVKTFEMYIFDRWGEKLYHTYDINKGWDGTVNGGTTVSQEDVYVYKITATDWQNNVHNYIGRVTLLR